MLGNVLKRLGNFVSNNNSNSIRYLCYKSDLSKTVDEYYQINKKSETNLEESFGEIPISDLEIKYLRSGKPGGQHVNKINTKVQVKFHVSSVKWIPENVKETFLKRESHRVTKDNHFIVSSEKTRQQLLNQADCMDRIRHAVRECIEACKTPETSQETKDRWEKILTKSNESRLLKKKNDSLKKSFRKAPSWNDL